MMIKKGTVLIFALFLAGCAYRGGIDQPVVRKLSWFSYLNGDDIRRQCTAGAPDRYRLVYNGIYLQQVRMYEIGGAGGGAPGATMETRVLGPADVSDFTVGRPGDLFAPWRGAVAHSTLSPTQMQTLRDDLGRDGAFDGAPEGLELNSADFYWTVVACVGGKTHFAAYRWPSKAFKELTFPRDVFAWDNSKIAVNPPHSVSSAALYRDYKRKYHKALSFNIRVGKTGLSDYLAF